MKDYFERTYPDDFRAKCLRMRMDGPTPCLCCPDKCVGGDTALNWSDVPRPKPRRSVTYWATVAVVLGLFFWLGLVLASGVVRGQHMHGEHKAVDWYDATCCNLRDCAPIPDPENVEDLGGGAHRYGPHTYKGDDVKPSKDSRVHVCVTPSGVPMCIYIRQGS